MRQVIEEFLSDRRDLRIKAKTKDFIKKENRNPDAIEIQEIINNAQNEFSFDNWIVSKSKNAYQIKISTHPSKFSHPDAKTSNIYFYGTQKNDGFLRSGNINSGFDVFGNAAQMDIFKFLDLCYADKTILDHIKNQSDEFKEVFNIENIGFEKIRDDFLLVIEISKSQYTSNKVKQIYFPIDKNEYHNLSILTNSFIASELNNKVREIKFSDQTKELKKLRKNNQFSLQKIEDLLNLFKISYGGSNAQNISSINAKNAGKFYLLPSLPPIIEKREIRLPKTDFFHQSLNKYRFKFHFEQLEKLIQDKRNNKPIRDSITNIVGDITDDVIEIIYKIRDFSDGWSEQENYKNLPRNQKILLDNHYLDARASNQESIDDFIEDLARWILACYQKFYPKTAKDFGDDELMGFERRINLSSDIKKSLNQIKGVL
jgi:CRISPR-associated protein Csy1